MSDFIIASIRSCRSYWRRTLGYRPEATVNGFRRTVFGRLWAVLLPPKVPAHRTHRPERKVPILANKDSHPGELHNEDGSKKEVRSNKELRSSADKPRTPAATDAQEMQPQDPTGHLPGIDTAPAPEPSRKPRKAPTGPHPALVRHFTAKWRERYGLKYRFVGKRDGKIVSEILDATGGDLDRARRVVDSYFASEDEFYAKNGHTLTLLLAKINTFIATTANGHSAEDGDWGVTPERANELLGLRPGDPGYIPTKEVTA